MAPPETGEMPTKSFFTDMIIDTPEAAAALEELIETGVTWKRGDSKFYHPDEDFIRKFCEKHLGSVCKSEDDSTPGTLSEPTEHHET